MIHVLIGDGDRRERELLRQGVLQDPQLALVATARDGQETVQMAVEYKPDVLVLRDDLTGIDGYQTAGLVNAVCPSIKTILLVGDLTEEASSQAMAMGVRHCIPRESATPENILAAVVQAGHLDDIRERAEYKTSLDPKRFPRLVAVTGAKGGVGKTSISANLASILAMSNKGPTVLVDTYTQFGDVATWFNLAASRGLVDVAASAEEIDLGTMQSITMKHSCGLDIIVGSTGTQPLGALSVARLDEVFTALRQHYRFIVADVPNVLFSETMHVLEQAHVVLLVCNLIDLTTVNDTRRWLEVMRQILPQERIRLILNRVSKMDILAADAVESALGMKAWIRIPNDFKLVSQCANRGVPFVIDSPNHPVSGAVRKLAEGLMTDADRIT